MSIAELWAKAERDIARATYEMGVAKRTQNRHLIALALDHCQGAGCALRELEQRAAVVPPAKIG